MMEIGFQPEVIAAMKAHLGTPGSSTNRPNPNCPDEVMAWQYHILLDESDEETDERSHIKGYEMRGNSAAGPGGVADGLASPMDTTASRGDSGC